MKVLHLELTGCLPCPYYKNELVVKETGRGYDHLHCCKKSFRGIVYEDKKSVANDPEFVIPAWCELPDMEKEIDNGMQKASSEKEEGLSSVRTGSGGPG